VTILTDQVDRDRITNDTTATLFVEAGAGSGKTKELTDRVVTLVLRDRLPISAMAVVTFTEKAGAELRDRLRGRFEQSLRAASDGRDAEATQLAATALEELDGAAIGTLHSFAQRILGTHPIEAGLPPLIEVLDEVASSVAFDERWSVMQRELLDDNEVAEPLLLAFAAGVNLDKLRSLARAFGDNWDLIEDRVLPGGRPSIKIPDPNPLVARARTLAARAVECRDAADIFLTRLAALHGWAQSTSGIRDDGEKFAALSAANALKFNHGRKGNWPDLEGLRNECRDWQDDVARMRAEFAEAALRPLAYWLAVKVHAAGKDRAADGRLEFHDLLVLARRLLRSDPDVREALRETYQVLLLDEFQDTDPIQLELAVRIAGGRDAESPEWSAVQVPDGSLFVVGDPKQSIYRFRRASISTYLQAEDWFGNTVNLQTNFRAVAPILDWVNAVFGSLITPQFEAQPAYHPLVAARPDAGVGPAVTVLGADAHQDRPNADDLREREARDVAAVIRQALTDGWTIQERGAKAWRPVRLGDIAILIPARTSLPILQDALDLAGVPHTAESSSLVYQAGEVRDLLAAARTLADPTDLLACVTALRSPLFGCGDDDLWDHKRRGGSFSILAPLDEDLATQPVGLAIEYLRRLHYAARWLTPSEVLTRLIVERRLLEIASAAPRPRDSWRRLRYLVDQARAWSETEHGGLRGYLAWATRQGADASGIAQAILPETDVEAVRIMTVHAAKGLEFPMVILSGLSSAARIPSGVQVIWPSDGGYEVRLTKTVQTNDFEAVQPIDEQMDALERRRLLYVAATRARDHLVVSLHRKPQTATAQPTNAQLLDSVGAADPATGAVSYSAPLEQVRSTARHPVADPPPEWTTWMSQISASRLASRAPGAITASGLEGTEPAVAIVEGAAEGDTVLGWQATPAQPYPDSPAAGHPGVESLPAESLTIARVDAQQVSGIAKGARDLELPPWSKGRYGTAIGRAAHAVLQSVDLATGAGIDEAVPAQCIAEGVSAHSDVVRGLTRSALDSEMVRRAATRSHLRESWVATVATGAILAALASGPVSDDNASAAPSPGTVVEGIVDLMYRDDDGTVVIVDYKTDAVPAAALPARAAFYAPQIRAYAHAVRAATGAPVRGTLLFLHPERPAVGVEVPVDS
jgi:ATP-dependent exoDNAse (exonuclease V) beta subunit